VFEFAFVLVSGEYAIQTSVKNGGNVVLLVFLLFFLLINYLSIFIFIFLLFLRILVLSLGDLLHKLWVYGSQLILANCDCLVEFKVAFLEGENGHTENSTVYGIEDAAQQSV